MSHPEAATKATSPGLTVRASSIDITPDHPVILGASGDPTRQIGRIAERLEANLAIFQTTDSAPVVLVTVDLLYAGGPLRRALEVATGLPKDRIWLAASHTHQAPMTDDSKPGLGRVDRRYLDATIERITAAAVALLTDAGVTCGNLRVGSSVASHSVNRRLPARRPDRLGRLRRRIRLAPNPRGSSDESVSVVAAHDGSGRPVFVLWNYACHPVAHPARDAVSAHFPHAIRERLREEFDHPDLPVLFMQGFSGDTRPRASARPVGLRRWLIRAVRGPVFVDMTHSTYRTWTSGLAAVVTEALGGARAVPADSMTSRRISVDAAEFVRFAGERASVSFQVLDVGPELRLVGVSAEVVSAYASWVRDLSPIALTLCIGCTDEPIGYLPTDDMLRDGGYEADGWCAAFGIDGVHENVEDHVKAGLAEVIRGR